MASTSYRYARPSADSRQVDGPANRGVLAKALYEGLPGWLAGLTAAKEWKAGRESFGNTVYLLGSTDPARPNLFRVGLGSEDSSGALVAPAVPPGWEKVFALPLLDFSRAEVFLGQVLSGRFRVWQSRYGDHCIELDADQLDGVCKSLFERAFADVDCSEESARMAYEHVSDQELARRWRFASYVSLTKYARLGSGCSWVEIGRNDLREEAGRSAKLAKVELERRGIGWREALGSEPRVDPWGLGWQRKPAIPMRRDWLWRVLYGGLALTVVAALLYPLACPADRGCGPEGSSIQEAGPTTP